jgi:hypothetical protein
MQQVEAINQMEADPQARVEADTRRGNTDTL